MICVNRRDKIGYSKKDLKHLSKLQDKAKYTQIC